MPRNNTIAWLPVLLAMSAVIGVARPALASAVQFTLAPGPVKLGFRAFGLGVVRIDGQFTRFSGTLTLDDADPHTCSLSIEAEAGSLQMPRQVMTDDALGPDLLDVAHFPEFHLDGRCEGQQLRGMLLLHGISRPILLDVVVGPGRWRLSGLIRRAEWGMSARPLLAGPEVEVSIIAGLPPGFVR